MYCNHCGGIIYQNWVRWLVGTEFIYCHVKCAKLREAQNAHIDPKHIFADAPRLVRCEYCCGQIDTRLDSFGRKFDAIRGEFKSFYYHLDCEQAAREQQ